MAEAKETRPFDRKAAAAASHLSTRHLRFGWWSVAVFGAFGLLLETLHGFKLGFYLDVSNETRRLLWTLAHAHGTLLGLVHIAFASTVGAVALDSRRARQASSALAAASLTLPGGFFLGGLRFYAGDPGIGVVLVPIGAVLVVFAAVSVAREV